MVAEILTGVDIADMDFNCRNFHGEQRVVQRNRGVGVTTGVDDDSNSLFCIGLVNKIDQFALAVRLPAIDLQAELS